MAGRFASILPRFVVLPALALLGTATITFAAETQLTPPAAPEQPQAAQVPAVIVVPDVRRQAYVFAKGTLEDAGFAWRVAGGVQGYAANVVVGQAPAPGTRVVDTGAPLITLALASNKRYGQKGTPENVSPYAGTPIKVAGRPIPAAPAPAAQPKPKVTASKPKPRRTATPKRKPKAATPQSRPPAFAVAGAPKEPLDEMPLDQRAKALRRYVAAHSSRSRAAVDHFLYQHAWIVTGAKFGWYHGAEALEILVAVDRRAQQLWGIGSRSAAVARAALAEVRAKQR
jgi:PASTA domain